MDTMTLIEMADKAGRAEIERMQAEHLRRLHYVMGDGNWPEEWPALPEGTHVSLDTYGLVIVLPEDGDVALLQRFLVECGWKRQGYSRDEFYKGYHEKYEDATGHNVERWHYATCTIREARTQ